MMRRLLVPLLSSLRRQLSGRSSQAKTSYARCGCNALSTDMAPPETPAEVTRCILQSLALTYRRTIDLCEQLTGRPVDGGPHDRRRVAEPPAAPADR